MLYRYIVTPKSPLLTELMSDALFGHFCWALKYREGESYLEDFLESHDDDGPAPVLFSSAFVKGTLPRPVLPPPPREELDEFIRDRFGNDKKSRFEGLVAVKSWKKRLCVETGQWLRLRYDYSDLKLYSYFADEYGKEPEKPFIADVTQSNTVNRISGAVEEGGGLFRREKIWHLQPLDLYVELDDSRTDEFKPLVDWFLLENLPDTGFGADKSAGLGYLSIKPDDDFHPAVFSVQGNNARMSIALAAFPGMADENAFYRLKVKFGKLGGDWAFSSPTGGNPRPFKKPVLMYEPGAVFLRKDGLANRPLLKNVHSDERIRHCGVPMTLPFTSREASIHDAQTS